MMKETNGQLETDTEDGKPVDKKEGLQLLIYDLKQRPLIAIKIFNFLIFSGKFNIILFSFTNGPITFQIVCNQRLRSFVSLHVNSHEITGNEFGRNRSHLRRIFC